MKRLHSLLFMALLALSVWVSLCHRAPRAAAPVMPPAAKTPVALVELALPGAALVASLDLVALRRSLWGRAALEQLLPLASKSEDCARSVIDQVERVALAIPADGSTSSAPEFGVLAEGNLRASRVLDCATRLLRARGGEPEASQLGGFQRLRDKKGLGELAVRDGGPLVLSGGSYFRALLERASGAHTLSEGARDAAESLTRDDAAESLTRNEQLHTALRRELGPAPLLLTWALPPGWLQRWLEDPEVSRSPLAELRALALRGDIGEQLSLRATLAAESAAGAKRIEALLRSAQAEFRPVIDAALGAGPSERIGIVQSGQRVELSLVVDTRALVSRWLDAPPAPSAHD